MLKYKQKRLDGGLRGKATNVVSLGVVTTTNSRGKAHALWEEPCDGVCTTTVFVVDGVCGDQSSNECDDDVGGATVIEHNGTMFVTNTTHEAVHELLNHQAVLNNWSLMWTPDLALFTPLPHQTTNVTIVFDKPMEREEVNETTISSIFKQLGVDGVGVDDVTIITDNHGRVTGVVVRIGGNNNTHDKAQELVTALDQELNKGGGCAAGVLCHATDVFIGGGLPSAAPALPFCLGLPWLLVSVVVLRAPAR